MQLIQNRGFVFATQAFSSVSIVDMHGRSYSRMLHIAFFYNLFIRYSSFLSSVASSGKPSGPGHLANDPYLCDVCGRAFPTKGEYDTHRLQH